jgi:hypothetical protein
MVARSHLDRVEEGKQKMRRDVLVGECDVGRGVFAARNFQVGEKILKFAGRRVARTHPFHDTSVGANLLQIGRTKYILPEPPGLFVNHSCDPNAGIRGNRTLVAIRPIEHGEEIRFDYSTTMDEDLWTMECCCHSHSCRHVVADFRLLPDPVREQYRELGVVAPFVTTQGEIRRSRPLRPAYRWSATG